MEMLMLSLSITDGSMETTDCKQGTVGASGFCYVKMVFSL